MPFKEHYRCHSEGLVKVYGNCAEINENYFTITNEQRKRLAHEQFTEDRIAVNKKFDEEFIEYVLAFGTDFLDKPKPKRNKPEPPKRERGDIQGFSNRSRYRLLKKYNRTNPDRKVKPYHIVLTYPKQFPTDGKEYKADLDAFLKRIKRRFGSIQYLWKLEFQKRGAPHYHIILYLEKGEALAQLREWIAINWFEVAQRFWEYKLENHINAGTSCDLVNDLKKASFYLGKYISKEETAEIEHTGRFWGCSRNWGDLIVEEEHLTAEQLIHFRRLVKRFCKGNYRMQKLITQPMNLVIFGHWNFFVTAIEWVKQAH